MTLPPPHPREWTGALRTICREVCAFYGDPPCWRLDLYNGDDGPCETCSRIARGESTFEEETGE